MHYRRSKKNPKRLDFGFKSTPKEEGGGDKRWIASVHRKPAINGLTIAKNIVQCKKIILCRFKTCHINHFIKKFII